MDRSIRPCATGLLLVVGLLQPSRRRVSCTDRRVAAVIRDTVYIDGGYLWWQPGMADGTYGALIADGMDKHSVQIYVLILPRKPVGPCLPTQF